MNRQYTICVSDNTTRSRREGWVNAIKVYDNNNGIHIYRWIGRYAYARNGNLGRETPNYVWTVVRNAVIDGNFGTLRAAKRSI